MNSVFIILFAILAAESLRDKKEREEVLWSKLEYYQNKTGLSDEEVKEIWQKSQDRKSLSQQGIFPNVILFSFVQGLPKLRVSTSRSQSSGTVSPITYDVVDFNHEMEYHNGVIIIIQSGWYTCTANTRGKSSNSSSTDITIWILVENREKSYGRR